MPSTNVFVPSQVTSKSIPSKFVSNLAWRYSLKYNLKKRIYIKPWENTHNQAYDPYWLRHQESTGSCSGQTSPRKGGSRATELPEGLVGKDHYRHTLTLLQWGDRGKNKLVRKRARRAEPETKGTAGWSTHSGQHRKPRSSMPTGKIFQDRGELGFGPEFDGRSLWRFIEITPQENGGGWKWGFQR